MEDRELITACFWCASSDLRMEGGVLEPSTGDEFWWMECQDCGSGGPFENSQEEARRAVGILYQFSLAAKKNPQLTGVRVAQQNLIDYVTSENERRQIEWEAGR